LGDKHGDKMDNLSDKIQHLIDSLGHSVESNEKTAKDTATSALPVDITQTFSDMKDMMAKQLDKHEEMIGHMRDTKDLTDRLLKVTM
jgi:ElaB/YqjD/DUF883 family membrane-anchored ribosome-binding protein